MNVRRVGIATAIAVSAVFASSAPAATAESWLVNSKALAGTAALATTASIEPLTFRVEGGFSVKVNCTSSQVSLIKPEIIAPSTGRAASILFGSCTIPPGEGLGECSIKGEKVLTPPVEMNLTKGPTTPEDRLVLKPQTKTVLFEMFLESRESCVDKEEGIGFTGSVTLGMPTGKTEKALQAVEGLGSTENNSLKGFLNQPTFLEKGRMLLRLASGALWSFR